MNLLNIISNEKAIGGLEISDSAFRFSRLTKNKSDLKVELLFEDLITEKEATSGESALTNKLVRFIKQHKLEYVVVTIPANNVYVKTYDFGKNITDEKIAEAMELNVDLQLPKKRSEIYCDWMNISDTENKKTLLAYTDKAYIKTLLNKVKNTGLKIVAVESHQLSLARSLKQTANETTLVIEKDSTYTSTYLIKNHDLLFSQTIPNEIIEKNINKEITKIVNYQDWLKNTVDNLVVIGQFSEAEIKKFPLKIKELELIDELKNVQNSKWIISLGAALRGLLPRKDDTIISLMEVDTEKAYSQEKVNGAVSFLLGISIALSVFFVSAFLATWYLILDMQNTYNQQISAASNTDYSGVQNKANDFNSLIGQAGALISKETNWSQIVGEIELRTTSDIIINNVSLPSVDGDLSVTGIANNREAINKLKTSFEVSDMFQNVSIPLNNLEKKADIPFSMTFKLKK